MENMKTIRRNRQRDVIYRWEGNPIITFDDIPFSCSDICNAAAVKYNNQYYLLITIENMNGRKSLYMAKSHDKYHFKVDNKPFITGSKEDRYEKYGVLDPRITLIGDIYYITYTASSTHGFRLAIAATKDFKSIRKLGFIAEPDTKGGVLFPEKINGRFAKLEMPLDGRRIWISYSDDLIYWGDYNEIMSPRGGFWDFNEISLQSLLFILKTADGC